MVSRTMNLFIFVQLFLLFSFFGSSLSGACSSPNRATSGPSYPANNNVLSSSLTPTPSSSDPLTSGHWSETAKLSNYRPEGNIGNNPAQSNCPHSDANLKHWQDASTWAPNPVPTNGSSVTIPAGVSILISSCSFDSSFIFGLITIPATSKLIFDDAHITMAATGFNVAGSLIAGSTTCRIRSKITITLHGRRGAQTLPTAPWVKGISVTGTIDLHGAQYFPTWTRLAMTAKPQDSWIFVQDIVNWQAGQTVVITTTELKDSRDWHRNEERTILAVKRTSLHSTVAAIQLDSPLDYYHVGSREYQAEVSLLSRNILIQGDAVNSPPTDTNHICADKNGISTFPCVNSYLTGFGGHIVVNTTEAVGRFSGVELFRMGQTNVLGRYPLHYHLVGNVTQAKYQNHFVRDCAVHESYFRCYAIHGTHGVLLTQNTAYNAIGHCYFLEDGVEEENIISYNQAALVHPLGNIQNPSNMELGNDDSWWGQYLQTYTESASLILPSDMSAGCFYITNAFNDIFGNAASGGWAGYAIPSLNLPVKLFQHVTTFTPANRPFRIPFAGNSAHSSGYWWLTGSALYVGGELKHNSASGLLEYNAGRSLTRNTCSLKGLGCSAANQMWLRFEDNKVFLSNRGMQNWGNRVEIIRLELHDVSLSMNVFGKVWIDQMLMECRTTTSRISYMSGCKNANETLARSSGCNYRDTAFFSSFGGFQWYDVGQKHILTNTVFRNCAPNWPRCANRRNCTSVAAFTSLTHSDQFVPELMQVSAGIKYENVGDLWRYSTTRQNISTVSGRLQSWYDPDGSTSLTNVRTMIGSAWAGDWWKYNSKCEYYKEAYKCPLDRGDSAASVIVKWNSEEESKIGDELCMNGGSSGNKCPLIGRVHHFGSPKLDSVLDIAVNAKLTGPLIASSGGWFFKFNDGTPKVLNFSSIQVAQDDIFLVAIAYPPRTTFKVTLRGASWCDSRYNLCSRNVVPVNSVAGVKSAFGDAYYYDTTASLLYVRLVSTNATFGGSRTNSSLPWIPHPPPDVFSRGGQSLVVPSSHLLVVEATSCSGDTCPKDNAQVPQAVPLYPPAPTTSGSSVSTGKPNSSTGPNAPTVTNTPTGPNSTATEPNAPTGSNTPSIEDSSSLVVPSLFVAVVVALLSF